MFSVQNTLVSDDLLDAPFCCQLSACKGACCVQGDSGAPIEEDEIAWLEEAVPVVWNKLTDEGRRAIEQHGVFERSGGRDALAVTCAESGACVFVTREKGIALCALQRAHEAGRLDSPKPISCHLYPLRISKSGEYDVLNYEQIPLCDAARKHGRRERVDLFAFLKEPLERRFGAEWYDEFVAALIDRRAAFKMDRPE